MLLGDWVAQITQNLGMKSCVPCQKRQAAMNQAHVTVKQKVKDFFFVTPPPSSGPSQPPTSPS